MSIRIPLLEVVLPWYNQHHRTHKKFCGGQLRNAFLLQEFLSNAPAAWYSFTSWRTIYILANSYVPGEDISITHAVLTSLWFLKFSLITEQYYKHARCEKWKSQSPVALFCFPSTDLFKKKALLSIFWSTLCSLYLLFNKCQTQGKPPAQFHCLWVPP